MNHQHPTDPQTSASRLELVRALGAQAAAVHRAFTRALDRLLAPEGLTHRQFQVLYQVHTHGPQPQTELAEQLAVESQTLVRLLDALERAGWVRRVPDQVDRRVKRVELAAAPEQIGRVLGHFEELQLAALGAFNEQELSQFLAMHGKLRSGLARHARELETTGS